MEKQTQIGKRPMGRGGRIRFQGRKVGRKEVRKKTERRPKPRTKIGEIGKRPERGGGWPGSRHTSVSVSLIVITWEQSVWMRQK